MTEAIMRLLFEMDKRDYDKCTHSSVRDSARSIIIKGERIALIYSAKYNYYKFPGGVIENRETPVDAMIRKTREEAGLIVLPDTVKEYGYVRRIQRSDRDETELFIQNNYYYLCEAADEVVSPDLDVYEATEAFTLKYVEPDVAIRKNRHVIQSPYNRMMFEREARVLEFLIADGLFER